MCPALPSQGLILGAPPGLSEGVTPSFPSLLEGQRNLLRAPPPLLKKELTLRMAGNQGEKGSPVS